MADVLPEWGNHHHRLSVGPGQVIIVVTWSRRTTPVKSPPWYLWRITVCYCSDTHHQIQRSCTEWWTTAVCTWCPVCCRSCRCWPQTGSVLQVPGSWWRCGRRHTGRTFSSAGTSENMKSKNTLATIVAVQYILNSVHRVCTRKNILLILRSGLKQKWPRD